MDEDTYDFGSFFEMRELEEVESIAEIKPRLLKKQIKAELIKKMRREKAAEILTALPAPGEEFHIVSNGSFDYFDFIPILISLAGPASRGYFSTWTLNRQNCLDLLKLHDDGKLESIHFLAGDYFKKRETAVYTTLVEGVTVRGGRVKTHANHAKIALLQCGENHLVMEGSANFTANPRVEQNIIANSKQLFEYHESWIKEIFRG